MSITLQTALSELNIVQSLSSTSTVNFDSSMTATQMQNIIDETPKNLNGNNLTFQFADGTYTMTSQLTLNGFINGNVYLLGNSSDSSLSTSKSVILNFTTANAPGIVIANTLCTTYVRYFDILTNTASGFYHPVYASNCAGQTRIDYSYLRGNGNTYGYGVGAFGCSGMTYVAYTYISNVRDALNLYCSNMALYNVQQTGTQPQYGISASYNSTVGWGIAKPVGSIGDVTSYGSVIRS